ncbi:hypothetical protein SLEP1_g53681 [Rubroshorea leprosula]|uniref:ZF-HD dimerization-type domain-containing protein n=1 Tax=Rubroshorea leprosula TaxID=152421 RepID=A0AAV5MCG8_9ROSI|nr:hypothetical protein SLEP1_g53681 [Rubroshorea leprosula]
MELSSHEGDIPIPINSAYMIHHDPAAPHHNHIIPPQMPSNGPSSIDDHPPYKKPPVKYRECLKNHAATMGGNAIDGCGEFMPNGEEGTIEALTCSACNCHRNFHRKEIEGEPSSYDFYHNRPVGRKVILGGQHKGVLPPEALGYPTGTLIHSRAAAAAAVPHQMIMSYNMGMGSLQASESEELQEEGGGVGVGVVGRPAGQLVKKRFRTKFTQEQKEKMFNFAEKVGWKIQKQEEAVVQQFCQEIGVKRRVLKVWMHNNKHNLAKKNISTAATAIAPPPATTTGTTTTTTATTTT